MPTGVVGNEFMISRPAPPRPAAPAPIATPILQPAGFSLDEINLNFEEPSRQISPLSPIPPLKTAFDLMHRYSLGVFAVLFLLIAASGIEVAKSYLAADVSLPFTGSTVHIPVYQGGPNMVVASKQLEATLQRLSSQPLSLTIADTTVNVGQEAIRSWIQAVPDTNTGVTYLSVDKNAISKSLGELAASHLKAPVNQVSVTRADGSSRVIAAGRNGTKLGDITAAIDQIAPNLLAAKGLQLTLPTETLNFAAVTPAAFDKMIEIDVSAKQMWLYQNGQVFKQYPISAGAPSTPTPLGQYKIFSKLAVQDMKGYNADGSKYFQPHVRWVNYFLPGGYAIHGNYWRPQSWFGAVNSSHGCASLPDVQAKEVYDWAPIGTTVITHG